MPQDWTSDLPMVVTFIIGFGAFAGAILAIVKLWEAVMPDRQQQFARDVSTIKSDIQDIRSRVGTLLAAVTAEATQRGRLPPEVTRAPIKPADVKPAVDRVPRPAGLKKPASSRAPTASDDAVPALSVGKTNAVRAAFMAGVKPSTIARQFGVSQAAVRQVLAAETRGRKL